MYVSDNLFSAAFATHDPVAVTGVDAKFRSDPFREAPQRRWRRDSIFACGNDQGGRANRHGIKFDAPVEKFPDQMIGIGNETSKRLRMLAGGQRVEPIFAEVLFLNAKGPAQKKQRRILQPQKPRHARQLRHNLSRR